MSTKITIVDYGLGNIQSAHQSFKKIITDNSIDARVLIWEASAVAQAAVDEGVSKVTKKQFNIEKYREELEARLGLTRSIMRRVINRARRDKKRIVFAEGEHPTIIKAAAQCISQNIS